VDALPAHGISLPDLTDRLLVDGVQQFRRAFERLLAALERKRADALHVTEEV
jgi:hypothetical protein